MKKILSGLISLVLVVGIFVGAYFLFFKKDAQEATSVMTMDVNPSVQFVLDQNNNVMSVTAVNDDGIKLLTQVNFEGMKAEDAAKMFVEVASKWGKVSFDASSDNKNVTIYISCDDEDKTSEAIKNLQTKVKDSVNQYFKDNGIINGAKVVVEDIDKALEKVGAETTELAGKTYEELVAYAQELSKQYEDVATTIDGRETIDNAIEALKGTFNKLNSVAVSAVDTAKSAVETAKNEVAKLKEEIKNETDPIQKAVNEKLLIVAEDGLKKAEETLKEAQNKLQPLLDQLQKDIDAKIKEVQDDCKTALANLKTEIKNAIDEAKTTLENHITEFKNKAAEEKQDVIDAIEAYQISLLNE